MDISVIVEATNHQTSHSSVNLETSNPKAKSKCFSQMAINTSAG